MSYSLLEIEMSHVVSYECIYLARVSLGLGYYFSFSSFVVGVSSSFFCRRPTALRLPVGGRGSKMTVDSSTQNYITERCTYCYVTYFSLLLLLTTSTQNHPRYHPTHCRDTHSYSLFIRISFHRNSQLKKIHPNQLSRNSNATNYYS